MKNAHGSILATFLSIKLQERWQEEKDKAAIDFLWDETLLDGAEVKACMIEKFVSKYVAMCLLLLIKI